MSNDLKSRIENDFIHHPLTTDERVEQHEKTREAFKALAHFVNANCPDGREKSLSLTKLEEAMFWANAAVARAE